MSRLKAFWEKFLEKIGFKYGMRLALYQMENISYDRLIDAIAKKDYSNDNIAYEGIDGESGGGDFGGSGQQYQSSPQIARKKPARMNWFWPVFFVIIGIIIAIILVLWVVKAAQ